MIMLLNKIAQKIRLTYFPTSLEREVKKWYANDPNDNLRYEYDLKSTSLVLDLGGYQGQFASDIYARYCCRVLVFEPVESFADKLKERFKRNSNIEIFNFALGSKARQETISLLAEGTSLYRESSDKAIIQFVDTGEFFADHNIQSVDLMKINIEGGEYELLPKLFEEGLINRVKNIQIQFHDIENGSEDKMMKLCRELSKTHRPTYQYKFVWENWVRLDCG